MGWFRRSRPAEPEPVEPAPTQADVAALRTELDELRRELATRSETIAAIDARLSGVGTELTHQLTELGGEIDRLTARLDTHRHDHDRVEPVDVEARAALDGLRTGQARLANEQARYQIAFLEDLADLADQVHALSRR